MDRREFCLGLITTGITLSGLQQLASADSPLPGPGVSKVRWHKNLDTAHKLAVESDKPMLIVFGASWCTYCHKLERETLADKRLVAVIERDFVPVHLDFDKDAKVAKILEVERLPCTVVLSPEADLLHRFEGFADYKGYTKSLAAALEKRSEIRQVRSAGQPR